MCLSAPKEIVFKCLLRGNDDEQKKYLKGQPRVRDELEKRPRREPLQEEERGRGAEEREPGRRAGEKRRRPARGEAKEISGAEKRREEAEKRS